jgi:hypothetical protein
VPPTPVREAIHEIRAELEEIAEQQLPPLSQSPEREAPKLGIGATVANPAVETRQQFLERAHRKLRCPMAKIVEKAKAVDGLWGLWPEEEAPAPAKKRRAEAKTKAEPRARAKPKAAPKATEEPPRKRGKPGSNVDLRARLLQGGEIQDMDEFERATVLVGNEMRQQVRMLKAGKVNKASACNEALQKLQAAKDRYSDANSLERTTRVEQQQRTNDLQVRFGVQLINSGSRGNSELLTPELRETQRARG